jgi:glycosyltransferase involved in cell wall biosynthesis
VFLLCIAQFVYWKGHDILLEAFSKISEKHAHVNLVILGGSGPMKESVVTCVKSLSLQERVFLYENVPHDRVGAFLRRALIFVLPSREESFGIVLLEAGAMNVPVVATMVGGIPEIVSDGESGFLVPPEDCAKLADRIEALIEDPRLRERFAANLHRAVRDHFTWNRAYLEYTKIISKC